MYEVMGTERKEYRQKSRNGSAEMIQNFTPTKSLDRMREKNALKS